jgi:hypothetical protein
MIIAFSLKLHTEESRGDDMIIETTNRKATQKGCHDYKINNKPATNPEGVI